jgi:hypothetical protein
MNILRQHRGCQTFSDGTLAGPQYFTRSISSDSGCNSGNLALLSNL